MTAAPPDSAQSAAPSRPDLKRTFEEVAADKIGEDETFRDLDLARYLRSRRGNQQDWTWLLGSRVIVILNEAGSGKTRELEDQIERLPENHDGFFFRIETLCRTTFAEAFEGPADKSRFQRWQRSRRTAVIFLDSIDEAKLPTDLGRNPLNIALRKVEEAIGKRIQRVRFVISTRPSAWKKDLELLETRRLASRFNAPKADAPPIARYVRLDPLTGDQMATLANWAGAPDDFLPALWRSGTRDFAETPLDLLDLVAAFKAKIEAGQPGDAIFHSLSELTDFSIRKRASEAGSDRARNEMPLERTREGARRLAAACVLGQTLTIRLAGSGPGVDPVEALTGAGEPWTAREIQQLLVCGLFTAGWQGSVRFQHRRTMERLAAEAFDQLIRAGMTVANVAEQLTPRGLGQAVIPKAYTEMVGWLASLSPDFASHIVVVAPQILIDIGDPGAHATALRVESLYRHAARYEGGIWRGEWFDHGMLRRFTDPALGEACRDLLRIAPAEEPKRLIIDLVLVSEFSHCVPALLEIVADDKASPTIRSQAARAALELDAPTAFPVVRRALLGFRPGRASVGEGHQDNNRFRLSVVAATLPHGLSLADALGVLSRLEPKGESYMAIRDVPLAEAITNACPAERLTWLIRWLARLSWKPDSRAFGSHDNPGWTAAGLYLLPVLQTALVRAIQLRPDLRIDQAVLWNLERIHDLGGVPLGPLREDDEDDGVHAALVEAVQSYPEVRRELFRMAFAASKRAHAADPIFTLEKLSARSHVWMSGSVPTDQDWMLEELRQSAAPRYRLALAEALTRVSAVLPRASRAKVVSEARRIVRGSGDTPALAVLSPPLRRRLLWAYYRQRNRWPRWKRRQAVRRLVSKVNDLRFILELRRRLPAIRAGRDSDWIWRAIYRDRHSELEQGDLAIWYGSTLADGLLDGLKAFARRYNPSGEHPRWRDTQMALLGWSRIARDTPNELDGLDTEQARTALAVAFYAHGFPEWAARLIERHPTTWRDLILDTLLREIADVSQDYRHRPTLHELAHRQPTVHGLVAQPVLDALRAATEADGLVIRLAARVIAADPATKPDLLQLARARFLDAFDHSSDRAAAWFGVWFDDAPAAAWDALNGLAATSPDGVEAVLMGIGDGLVHRPVPVEILGRMAIDYMRWVPIAKDRDDKSDMTSARRDAEQMRANIPTLIAENPTPEAHAVLLALARAPEFAEHGGWMQRVLDRQAANAAAPRAWREVQVADFMAAFLKRPGSAGDLHTLILRHLEAIEVDLRTSDFDVRGLFRDALERDIRAWFGRCLKDRSQGWYSVTQETVTAAEKRMDLRIEGRTLNGENAVVVVEIKRALPTIWNGDALMDHLQVQLVDQYLPVRRARHGVYLVIQIGDEKDWTIEGAPVSFAELGKRLRAKADTLVRTHATLDALTVLTPVVALPSKTTRQSRTANPKPTDIP